MVFALCAMWVIDLYSMLGLLLGDHGLCAVCGVGD
jgi:hypothetical protein